MQRIALVVAAGLLGGWSPLAAQSSVLPTPIQGEPLVVTASLEPDSPENLPATVEVIDGSEIALRQDDRVIDLLRTVAGFSVAQSGSAGKVASLFSRGVNSNQTLVLWNGVELNDPAFGGFDASTLSTDGVDRVEVARGPFSAVWGSSAMGGVVELITRRGGASGARARLEDGANAYRRAAATASWSGDHGVVEASGHVRRGDGELRNDFFDGDELDLRGELFPRADSRVGLLLRRARSRVGIPFDYLGSPTLHQEQAFRSTLVALPVGWNDERWRVDGVVSRHDGALAISDLDDPFAASRTAARRDALRLVGEYRLTETGRISAGVDGQRESATTESAFGPGLDGRSQRNRAAFGQFNWGSRSWRATLGLRHDDNDAFGGATSLRGGVVAAVGRFSHLRASYGESFRAPSLGDLYYPGFSNPDLRPERGRSWELGLDGRIARASYRATGFWNDLDQLILYDFTTGRPENIGRARTRGVELAVSARLDAWELRASGTWLDAVDRQTGEALPRRAKQSGELLAFYRAGSWNAGVVLRQVGPRTDVGAVPLAGYAVLDFTVTLAADRRLAPFFKLDNALDRRYEEAAGYPAPGRAWIVGLSLRAGS